MIDLKDLVSRKDFYKNAFKNKGLDFDKEINKVISLYEKYLKKITLEQEIRKELNDLSKEVKKASGKDDLLKKAKKISEKAKAVTSEIFELNKEINDITSYFPNPADEKIPIGKDESNNKILKTFLDDKKKNEFSKPHWEIIEEKKLTLDKEVKFISGARHIIYQDKAAHVIKALELFLIEENTNNGYKLVDVPVLVNKEVLYNTSQLPKFEDDLFKLDNGQYLIPTSEVPLTNLVANQIVDEKALPLKFTASTMCFRKEAGSAGKDTRGIIRLHQFRKTELVKIGKRENEKKDFDEMIKTSTNILNKLKIPYRLVELCTGDMSFGSRKTIDIEVWMPGVDTYREISSVSSMGDFQARRMKSRYKNEDTGKKEFVFTYNGSSLAIDRLFAAILENYINKSGDIVIPTVLKKYLPFVKM